MMSCVEGGKKVNQNKLLPLTWPSGWSVCFWNGRLGVRFRVGLNQWLKIAFICISGIFILLSRESDQSAITNSLESCRIPVYHTKTGESRQVLFPTAQVNLPACSPHCPSNAERQTGKLWIPMLKSLVWPDSKSNPYLQLLRRTLLPLGHRRCKSRYLWLSCMTLSIKSDSVKNKPASSFVVPFGTTLSEIYSSWSGRQVARNS